MAVIGFSHGRVPVAAACTRMLNAHARSMSVTSLEPRLAKCALIRIGNILETPPRFELRTLHMLHLIPPIGVSGNEQNLPDLAPGIELGFFINEDHQVHGFSDQRLLRRAGCFGNQTLETYQ